MTGIYVGLIYGFCAGIVEYGPQNTLLLGYKSAESCITVLELTGDSYPHQDVVASGHTIHWRWLSGGAELQIDDQWFVIPKVGNI